MSSVPHTDGCVGAIYVNMDSHVDNLQIKNREHIAAFLMRAVVIETSLEDSGASISPNRLTKRILTLLQDDANAMPFLAEYMGKFAKFIPVNHNKQFDQNSATATMNALTDSGLNLNRRLFCSVCPMDLSSNKQVRNYDHRIRQFGSDGHFGTPIVEPNGSTSEFASPNNEQQEMPGINETVEDNCEQHSTHHHRELEYRPQ